MKMNYNCSKCNRPYNSISEAVNCKLTCEIDNRNVVDIYKYWKTDAIKAALDVKRHNFSVLITNQFHDFNIGSVIRNCNAFLAKKIYIFGRRKFYPRGTVGTHHYENIVQLESLDELPQNSKIIGFDDLPFAKPLDSYQWDNSRHIVMCFGQESVGLNQQVVDKCTDIVYIRQYGSVRSLNVGCASAIAMFHFCSQLGNNINE